MSDVLKSTREIEVIDDFDFSYDGYQVVRGEFFAHTYEPMISFNQNKVFVNTACIRKLPETDYVQILVNPESKKLAVRPCAEEEKDSFRWSTGGKKRGPKQIRCRIFYAKVMSLMGWNPDYRYKLLGKLVNSNGELLFVFDLTTPEIYIRTIRPGEKARTSRTATYPDEWKNQFGLPVEEHQNNLQVDIFDGYAVFGLEDEKKKEDSHDRNNNDVVTTGTMSRFEEEPYSDTQANSSYAGRPGIYPATGEPGQEINSYPEKHIERPLGPSYQPGQPIG